MQREAQLCGEDLDLFRDRYSLLSLVSERLLEMNSQSQAERAKSSHQSLRICTQGYSALKSCVSFLSKFYNVRLSNLS